jgi:hypothetical protein
MNDALEILDDLELQATKWVNDGSITFEAFSFIAVFLDNKRSEFAPASGDCCG